MNTVKQASFNVDVDPLWCYNAIHGLGEVAAERDPIYSVALPRFISFLQEEGIKATFFITAKNMVSDDVCVLQRLVEEGHEIASHSFAHDYRISLKQRDHVLADLKRNEDFLIKNVGVKPIGFRAPGYNTSKDLISELKAMGYSYDSSSFPSLLYFAAKWFLIRWKKLRGCESASFIASFKDAFDSHRPYFLGESLTEIDGSSGLREFPISTVCSIPFIGTSIIGLPEKFLEMLLRALSYRSFLNIEMHGIDAADADDSKLYTPLKGVQPDLKYSIEHKLYRMRRVIRYFKEKGFQFKRLDEIT